MPYSLTRNFPFGKIKQNHSKLNKTERNGKGEKQKMKKKNLSSPYRGNFNNRPYDRNCFCGGHRSER